jgi:RNA recognition motif-containing protein
MSYNFFRKNTRLVAMAHRHWDPNCKIYIGGLSEDANRYDLEDQFAKFGPVRDVWVARRPPGQYSFLSHDGTCF